MSLKGFITSVIMAVLLCLSSFIIGVKFTLIILGLFYIIQGILYQYNKDYYIKIQNIINADRERVYESKSDEFKEYIKSDPISCFFVGILFMYLGFRYAYLVPSIKYYIAVSIFVISNYFIEIYAMSKSVDWQDYKKKSILPILIILIFVLFLLN